MVVDPDLDLDLEPEFSPDFSAAGQIASRMTVSPQPSHAQPDSHCDVSSRELVRGLPSSSRVGPKTEFEFMTSPGSSSSILINRPNKSVSSISPILTSRASKSHRLLTYHQARSIEFTSPSTPSSSRTRGSYATSSTNSQTYGLGTGGCVLLKKARSFKRADSLECTNESSGFWGIARQARASKLLLF
ncbi:unnamed protein product [Protopolystoma xenopodis]|uniref:Uncharacterized protein n=1 Tax=Protopolystoma xenopodis TaxID=117903 RepID=A0A448XJT6_9PLAT|nr:unnamed protein product [Protopolystoma xenopodis]